MSSRNPITSRILENWREGNRHFNQGRYWHAHESWEQGWKDLPFGPRLHLQAVIQAAAVFVLLEKKRPGPARTVALRALEKFAQSRSVRGRPYVALPGVQRLLRDLAKTLAKGTKPAWRSRIQGVRARVIYAKRNGCPT